MKNTFLIITSIAGHDHLILKKIAEESSSHNIPFIVVGDTKSPKEFNLAGCDYYSVERQQAQNFELAKTLPLKHYARKNLGYLIAISKGAEIIIETDDDNLPLPNFWDTRTKTVNAHLLSNKGWVNIYKYFTDIHVWPRGFALENIKDNLPELEELVSIKCPIQQGLADENPDVDAIYRLTLPLPITFNKSENIALGTQSFCPFNSQNTTWFKEAFPLLYLPSYCSFRMTDIWRSFIAQRIAWTCGWSILFHNSSVWQQRNDHSLMTDFRDEIPGYNYNTEIYKNLKILKLKEGIENIPANMKICYKKLIELNLVSNEELILLDNWLDDCKDFNC
ncbi:MAG: STELLO glycosyltransferase family protein [Candidatus Marinimicrobia bacterium]|nr:STELLO glycosyltransferase family protein [Candidatus Neomarinimicrobiota bacterium]